VVILALGANDGLRGLSVNTLRDNLNAMVRKSQAAGARVLIAGMQLPPNYGPDYTQKFAATFNDVSKSTGSALLPFLLDGFATDPKSFQADGIHPVAAAQPRIVDNIWAVLRPLLGKPLARR
jgi:acyl-CoA thioesterase-1